MTTPKIYATSAGSTLLQQRKRDKNLPLMSTTLTKVVSSSASSFALMYSCMTAGLIDAAGASLPATVLMAIRVNRMDSEA
jgi:hypothetical protein